MKALAKKIANRVKSKNIVKENQGEYVRVKRKVLVKVKRRVESQENQGTGMIKDKFLETVNKVLASQRLKNALSGIKNKISFERFVSSDRRNATEANFEENEIAQEETVEIIGPGDESEQQYNTLYMPLQF